ncbi:DUF6048 family protein [Gangjinia marincola]|uniref:DUF6048 family protein n=1 Tax=Gangjinia marincola TaxID=578463 RepID=A0ABN1MGC7_9FLAO
MYRYFFNIFFALTCVAHSIGQNDNKTQQNQDSIVYQEKYGLRIGVDLVRPIKSLVDENLTAFEVNADYRLSQKLYAAGELGYDTSTYDEENLLVTAQGSYIKLGVNYDTYENWLGMRNSIYAGVRYAFASFSQDLEEYVIYNSTQDYFEPDVRSQNQEFSGLTAGWIELQGGIKVELVKNIYIAAHVQLKRRVNETKPDGFDNLYIPGFNRTYDGSTFGVGWGYSINYFLPLYKKDKR